MRIRRRVIRHARRLLDVIRIREADHVDVTVVPAGLDVLLVQGGVIMLRLQYGIADHLLVRDVHRFHALVELAFLQPYVIGVDILHNGRKIVQADVQHVRGIQHAADSSREKLRRRGPRLRVFISPILIRQRFFVGGIPDEMHAPGAHPRRVPHIRVHQALDKIRCVHRIVVDGDDRVAAVFHHRVVIFFVRLEIAVPFVRPYQIDPRVRQVFGKLRRQPVFITGIKADDDFAGPHGLPVYRVDDGWQVLDPAAVRRQ